MNVPLRRGAAITTGTLAALAVTLYLLLAKPFSATGAEVRAEFGSAGQGLRSDSPVKVRGVQVGRVAQVRLGQNGRVHLTLRLDPGYRVPATAVAAIEPASVFGPKFVNLVPGDGETSGPYLADGDRVTRTADPTDLAQLLADVSGVVEAVDPADVATLVRTLAHGLDGQGPALRRIVEHTDTLVGVAHRHRADARRFLRDGADLGGALAKAGPDVVRAAGDTNHVIDAAAAVPEGSLGAFAAGLGDVSLIVAHGLDKRGDQLGESFRSAERLVSLLYGQLGDLGGAIRAANQLLPVYNDLAKVPAANGKHYLGVHAYLPSNPCELVLGLCGRP
ncbi:MCE family protein [Actinocorallia sp. API 0066]|uniref:MlaD family protein n=1 Tax=Actinocorallia sp. API 0066 TaxID=2896846 RepID=UPI001E446834|nr:MlaD family protein [Actinocorallia sp. API 0066]MCD0449360.1 MCE family protein [Actinocorallia sp. API 0066]